MADDDYYDPGDDDLSEGAYQPSQPTALSGLRAAALPPDRYAGEADPEDMQLEAPRHVRNMTGTPLTGTASTATSPLTPSQGSSAIPATSDYSAPVPQPSDLAPWNAPPPTGRAVKSAAPVKFVTNSAGKKIPIDAEGNDALNPIPGNAKYLTGPNGELYHAQPDDNGTFTRAEDSLTQTADGKGRLRSHVPGVGYIDQGEDTKFTAAQKAKDQKAQEKLDKDAATEAAKTNTANLESQFAKGSLSVSTAREQLSFQHTQAFNEAAKAETNYKSASDTVKGLTDALGDLQGKDASPAFATLKEQLHADNDRKKVALGGTPSARALNPDFNPDDDTSMRLMPPMRPEDRKLVEDTLAQHEQQVAELKAQVQAAKNVRDRAAIDHTRAVANKQFWIDQQATQTQALNQAQARLTYNKRIKVLTNTGQESSIEAQQVFIPPPLDANLKNADAPQPTPDQIAQAGTDLVVQAAATRGQNVLAPRVTVAGVAPPLPKPGDYTEADRMNLASLSQSQRGTAYHVPDGSIKLDGSQVKTVDGKPVADLDHTAPAPPRIYLKPDSSGQFHSLSLNSGHPYDGVPEYTSPSPAQVEALGKAGVDTKDPAAVQKAWADGHWSPDKLSGFLTSWDAANDHERQGIIAQVNPEQANVPEGQRALNTRALAQSGQISLQEARHLDFKTKGRQPGILPFEDAFKQFRTSDAPEAKQLRESETAAAVPPTTLGTVLTAGTAPAVSAIIGAGAKDKALQDAVAASAADYYKRNSNSPDFDPVAFEKAKVAAYGKGIGPTERLASTVSSTLQGLVGFGASLPVSTANEVLGQTKQAVKATPLAGAARAVAIYANPADLASDAAATVGVHANTPEESEIVRKRTEGFGRKFASFFGDRLNWDSAKDLSVKVGSAMGTGGLSVLQDYLTNAPRSAGMDGKAGKAMGDTTDQLFKLADSGKLTDAQTQELGLKLRDAAVQVHGLTNYDSTNKTGYDYEGRYDLTDPRSPLAQMLASYAETRDPAYKAMFHNVLANSAGDQETQKWLAEYGAAHGHIQGSTAGALLDAVNRVSGGALHTQDPNAWTVLHDSFDVHQPLQVPAATEAGSALAVAPEILTGLFKGVVPSGLRSTGAALLDSARVANGAAKIEDVLAGYTTKAMLPPVSPVAAGATSMAESALHGAGFMAGTEPGNQYGTSVGDVTRAGATGLAIGAAMGVPSGIGAGMAARPEAQAALRVQQMSDRLSKLNPASPVSPEMVQQAMRYMGPDEAPRLAAMQQVAAQHADIKARVADGTAAPEEAAQLPALRNQLDGHFAAQQKAVTDAVKAAQEINGVADPVTRSFAHGLLKSRQGATLTPSELDGVLRVVDTNATPDVNGQYPSMAPQQPDGSFVITDAGLGALQNAVPDTFKRFAFPNSETEQLDAIKAAQMGAPPPDVVQPTPQVQPPPENVVQPAPPPPAPEPPGVYVNHPDAGAHDPAKPTIHYAESPSGRFVAQGDTGGAPESFPHEAALHNYFKRPLTQPEKITLAKERAVAKSNPQTPAPDATRPVSPAGAEHPGVSPGQNVPGDQGQVRQTESRQAGGGSGVQPAGKVEQKAPAGGAKGNPVHAAIRQQIAGMLKGTKLEGLVKFHDTEPAHMALKEGQEQSGGLGYAPKYGGGRVDVSLPTIERQAKADKWTPQETRRRVALMLDEELQHHADELAMQSLHKDSGGKPGDYNAWKKEYGNQQWAKDFTAAQKAAVLKQYGPTLDAQPDYIKAAEARRMLLQLRKGGGLTETWHELSKGVTEWLQKTVAAIRDMAQGGKLTKGLQDHLEAAEALLKEHGYKGPNLDTGESSAEVLAKMKAEAVKAAVPAAAFHEHADALDKAADHIEAAGGVHHVGALRDDAEALRKIAVQKEASDPSALLRKSVTELPAAAQKVWAPDALAKADAFFKDGDAKHLDGLTSIQQRKVHAARLESDPTAAAADQAQEDRLRREQADDLRHARATTEPGKALASAPDQPDWKLRDPTSKLTPKEQEWFDWAKEGASDALNDQSWLRDNEDALTPEGQIEDMRYRLEDQAHDVAETDSTMEQARARHRSIESLLGKLRSEKYFDRESHPASTLASAPDQPEAPNPQEQHLADLLKDEGKATLADFTKAVNDGLGEHAPEGLAERLHKMAFPEVDKMPDKSAAEPEPEVDPTGITKAAVEARRKAMGKEPLPEVDPQSFEEWTKAADATLRKNPAAGDNLIKDLVRTKRPPNAKEVALLARATVDRLADVEHATDRIIELRKTADDARKSGDTVAAKAADDARIEAHAHLTVALERVDEVEKTTDPAGTEQARAFVARKLIAKNAIDFPSMVKQLEALRDGEPLSKEEKEQVLERSNALKAQQKAVDKVRQAQETEAAKAEVHTANQETQANVRQRDPAIRVVDSLKRKYQSVRDAILQKRRAPAGSLNAAPPEGTLHSAPDDPLHDYIEVGKYHLADGKTDYTDWKAAMLADFGDDARPHLEDAYQQAGEEFAQEKKSEAAAKTPAGVLAKAKAKGLPEAGEEVDPKLVRDLARAHIEAGHQITDEASSEALTTKIHADLKDLYPDATHEDVRSAARGYKEPEPRTREDAEKMAAEYRTQSQLVSKLEDASKGKMPWRMGGWDKPSDEVRRLSRAVRDMIDEQHLIPEDKAKEMANAQERARTLLNNTIADLERQVKAGVRDMRLGGNATEFDADMKAKQARIVTLREQVAKLNTADMHLPGALFSEASAKLVAAKVREADLVDRLNRNVLDVKARKPDVSHLIIPELKTVRDNIAKLNKEVAERRRAAGKMDQQMLARIKKAVQTRADKMAAQIKSGDFSTIKKAPYKYGDDKFAAQDQVERAKLNQLKREWAQEKEKARLANRGKLGKAYDLALKIRRAEILSSYVTAGKLGMAAGYQTAAMVPDEIVGGILSKIPGIKSIADRAPIEGGYNLSSVGRSVVKGWVDGIKNFTTHVREGGTEIDKANDPNFTIHHLDHSWLDWIGSMHSALKAPAKIAAFEHAMTKSLADAEKRGLDPRSQPVQAWAAERSYKRAERAVFAQDGAVVEAYKSAINSLERRMAQKGGVMRLGAAGMHAFLKWFFPIVKVPLNVAAAGVSRSPVGLLRGVSEVAVHHLYTGIDSLNEDQADAVMRHLKDGSVGTALWALGYFGASSVGGFYQRDKAKRNREGVPPDRFRLGGAGAPVTPSWATHSPLLDQVTMGATYRHIAESLDKKTWKKRGINGGMTLVQMLYGLADHVPFVSTPKDLFRAEESDNAMELWWGNQMQSLVPAFVRDYTAGKGLPTETLHRLVPELDMRKAGVDVTPEGKEIKRTTRPASPTWDKVQEAIPFRRATLPRAKEQPTSMVSPFAALRTRNLA